MSELRRIIILILVFSIPILGVFFSTWESDSFQKAIFPEKYWTKEVKKLEQAISAREKLIRSNEIRLNKEREIKPIEDYYSPYEWRALLGDTKNVDELVKFLIETREKEIKDLEVEVKILKRIQEKDRQQLEKAIQELSKVIKSK